MKDLVKIEVVEGKQTVNARDLHKGLEVGRDFSSWIKGRIVKFDFVENEDFIKSTIITSSPDLGNATQGIDYHLTISMAKELCMVENNEQGRKIRKYFIACEQELQKRATAPMLPEDYISALRALADSEEQKKIAQEQRDQAIATKAEIGSRREATAMNTASQAVKQVKRLEIELDRSKEYASVKAVEALTKQKFNWRPLRNYCTANELDMKKIHDANYGAVNTYPAEAWQEVYSINLNELF